MNADKIIICPILFILLHVSKIIVGCTAKMKMLHAHFTHHWVRGTKLQHFL
jgi:hypothetical protein